MSEAYVRRTVAMHLGGVYLGGEGGGALGHVSPWASKAVCRPGLRSGWVEGAGVSFDPRGHRYLVFGYCAITGAQQ